MRHSLLLGYGALALAQVAISLNVVTSKHLLNSLPMFTLLASRFAISSILLGLLLKFSGKTIADGMHPEGKLNRQDWLLTILQGVFAAFLFNVFFVWGLEHTTASAAGIVGSTLPAIIALCAVWMLKEQLKWPKIAAIILAMIGILIINIDQIDGTSNAAHTFFGDFLVFLAMFPEAWYSILGRKLAQRVSALGAAFIANVVGFITLLPCAILGEALDFSLLSWPDGGFLMVSAMSSLIFFCFWGWGLSFIPASTAAIFGGIMPIATTIFAIFFLEEHLQWYDILGMVLVIVSIVVGASGRVSFRKIRQMVG